MDFSLLLLDAISLDFSLLTQSLACSDFAASVLDFSHIDSCLFLRSHFRADFTFLVCGLVRLDFFLLLSDFGIIDFLASIQSPV